MAEHYLQVRQIIRREEIRQWLRAHPAAKGQDVAKFFGITAPVAYKYMREIRLEWSIKENRRG